MNFLKKQFTKFAKKKVKEIVSAPKEERNPQLQKLIDEAGGFLNKYTPGQIDATEFIEKALARIDWASLLRWKIPQFYTQRYKCAIEAEIGNGIPIPR